MRSIAKLLVFASAVFVTLVAVPALAHVRPVAGVLPDGDERPQIHSAELRLPQAHNNLLEADLVIDASDNDGIIRFEYRWNSATIGSIKSTSVSRPTVDYSWTTPNTRAALQLRAIDLHNNPSDWYTVWTGMTPSPPNIIVAGDSIASGYTKRWFVSGGTCRSDLYSYGSTVTERVNAVLPNLWAATYTNIAWAGAGVGNVLAGGTDSCGVAHPDQVRQVQDLTEDSTWNVVLVTAGINSTNWTDVIVALTRDTAFSFSESGDRNACELAVSDRWNIDERADTIVRSTRDVSSTILDTTNARLIWTGYYDITGTQIAPLWTPIGDECSDYMATALDKLHDALQSGLDPRASWLDIDKNISTQSWAGWPHPDAIGQATIGSLAADVVLRRR